MGTKENDTDTDNVTSKKPDNENKKIVTEAAKKIGSKTLNVATSAGKGVANALNSVSNSALSGLRNAGRAIGGPGESSSSGSSGNGAVGILFALSLIMHLYDAVTKFQRPGFILYFYIGLLIFSFFFIFNMKLDDPDAKKLLIVLALAYLLPYVVSIFPDNNFALALSGILFLIPILPIYIGLQAPEGSFINRFIKIYIIIWIIILAFYLIATFAPDQNTKALVKNPFGGLGYVIGGASDTIDKTKTSFFNTLKRAIAQATGQPYDGDEESRVGVYVENVKQLESSYNTNSNVFVEARIRAVNVKEPLRITTNCYIPSIREGTTNPKVFTEVIGDYDNIIDCDLGQLNEGNYEVKVRATFEFESTSDIEYTFVSTDVKSDQYDKLKIDRTTIATYTGGPVALGLPSLGQPLRIDTGEFAETVTYAFGVSLENKWPQGKIVKGINYTLNTPEEVKLKECTRKIDLAIEPNNEGRNIYIFKVDTNNAQDTFDAVRCRMDVTNPSELLGNGLKSVKTFAAKATYQYYVEGSTNIRIEQS